VFSSDVTSAEDNAYSTTLHITLLSVCLSVAQCLVVAEDTRRELNADRRPKLRRWWWFGLLRLLAAVVYPSVCPSVRPSVTLMYRCRRGSVTWNWKSNYTDD